MTKTCHHSSQQAVAMVVLSSLCNIKSVEMSGEVFSALISNHISILKRKAMQTVVCMAFFIFLNFSKKNHQTKTLYLHDSL